MERVRLGVVGCGVMGARHLEAALESPVMEPYALAERFEDRRAAAAEEYGVRKAYESGAELIEDCDVDAVVLAMPTCERDELAVQALQAGKHLLVEKPVAMNAAAVERMIAARGDRVAACCSCRFHFTRSARAAAELIGDGVLGRLRVIYCRAHGGVGPARGKMPPAWRLMKALNGGGILVNWGCYDLDYLLGLTGWQLRPRTVLARTWTVPPRVASRLPDGSDAETHFTALIACDGGTVISFERGEYMPAHTQNAWQIVGDHGALNLVMTPMENKQIVHDELTADGLASHVIWQGTEGWDDNRGCAVKDFAEAIVEGREPRTTLEKAFVIQRISDAVYESAETGKAVELD